MEDCQRHKPVTDDSLVAIYHPNAPTRWAEVGQHLLGFDSTELRMYLSQCLHPRGLRCPRCSRPPESAQESSLYAGKRVRCHRCNSMYKYRSGTILAGSRMPVATLYFLALCLNTSATNAEIARLICVHPDTVSRWRARLR